MNNRVRQPRRTWLVRASLAALAYGAACIGSAAAEREIVQPSPGAQHMAGPGQAGTGSDPARQSVAPQETVDATTGLPHEVPGDLPADVPDEPRVYLPAQVWERGGFQSVQVNVIWLEGNPYNIPFDAANEPSIAVDPNNPNWMSIGWRQFDHISSSFRQAGVGYSHDGGRTWMFPGSLDPGVFRSDPVLDADSAGNFYYYSLQVNGSSYTCELFKSTDWGVTWTPPIPAHGGDKAWLAIDRTEGPGAGFIYAAWDAVGCCGDDWFTRSIDGGMIFHGPVPIPQRPIWGVTTVGPEGEVYVVGRRLSTNQEFVLAKSVTMQFPELPMTFGFDTEIDLGGALRGTCCGGPNPNGLLGQVWVATDHSSGSTRGNVYVLASVIPFLSEDPLELMFIRSTDGGATWTAPIRVNDDPLDSGAWQWFGTLSVAPNGRLDAVWNDTRNSGEENLSELFYAFSTDAGDTWSTNIPISQMFDSHVGWPQQNKLGDYYDMVSDEVGVSVAYAATFNGEQDVYYLRIGDYDCNRNGVGDSIDIAQGSATDCHPAGGNGIPDVCECVWDLDGNGAVNPIDSGVVMSRYGCAVGGGDPACDACDIDCNGVVNPIDSGLVMASFGKRCP